MRVFLIAVVCALGACGGAKPSQANSVAANSVSSAAVVAASVSGAKAVAVMHERHEGMETIGDTNKVLRRELGGTSPDIATVRSAAAKIADLARRSSGWFPAGTGPDVGKTGAKPVIWQNGKDFAAKLAAFQHASAAFNAAAQSGSLDAIHARYADLGGTCKACHDTYRSDMHH